MKLGVVGLGLIGGSLLRALGGVGYDADPAVRSEAAADGFEVVDAPDRLADRDLVLVAVPPAITYDVVRQVLTAAPRALVADTASVKGNVPELDRFVAAHPMGGAESAGWAASSEDLLRGATWAACPSRDLEPLVALAAAVDRLGGRIVACTDRRHDEAVARVSHVPHLVAQALARLAAGGLATALAGPAFRDMTRVARADAGLWTRILAANREHCDAVLDELIDDLRSAEGWSDTLPSPAAADWAEETVAGWEGLLALGAEGRAVRRLRRDGDVLRAEVAR